MAWMNQERKAKIAAKLKPILKQYGVKGTLSVRNHSTIVLTLKSGSIDFIGNYADTVRHLPGRTPNQDSLDLLVRGGYLDVNQYWYHEHFTGVARQFIEDALVALKSADWYNNSDAQIDYFDTAYYMDINIGRWNLPYRVEK